MLQILYNRLSLSYQCHRLQKGSRDPKVIINLAARSNLLCALCQICVASGDQQISVVTYLLCGNNDADLFDGFGELAGLHRLIIVEVEILEALD